VGDTDWAIEGTSVDVRDAWEQLLAEIRLQMTRVTFDTWMGGTEVVGVHGKVASVLVRDEYAADWLGARWRQPIERTLSGIVGCPVEVRFLSPGAERRGIGRVRSP
jgi:chromosomal replication initiator protein